MTTNLCRDAEDSASSAGRFAGSCDVAVESDVTSDRNLDYLPGDRICGVHHCSGFVRKDRSCHES